MGTDELEQWWWQWGFAHGCASGWYLLYVLVIALLVRVAFGLLKAAQLRGSFQRERFWYAFWETVWWSPDPRVCDYFHGFFVGLLELLVFPVLIATGAHAYIGAWLSFKVVAEWRRWGEDRTDFNRFLILNALVLVGSYWLSGRCIAVVLRFAA